jgi:hypothetical protein
VDFTIFFQCINEFFSSAISVPSSSLFNHLWQWRYQQVMVWTRNITHFLTLNQLLSALKIRFVSTERKEDFRCLCIGFSSVSTLKIPNFMFRLMFCSLWLVLRKWPRKAVMENTTTFYVNPRYTQCFDTIVEM